MKKTIALAAALLLMLLVLAGCSEGTSTEGIPTPTPSASVTSGSEKVNAIKPGDVYRYYLWSTADEDNPFKDAGARSESMKERLEEFQTEYGITIKYVESTGGYEWYALPRSSAAAGEPICDIFNVGGPYVVLGTYFYGGQAGQCIIPLSDYSDVADFSDPEYWDTQSQQYCTFDDKLYCVVPNGIGADTVLNNTVTLFNKDILKDNGYTADQLYAWSEQGEWTWEKFREAALACTDQARGVYGTAIGDNVALASALIVSNGGAYFENNGTTDVFVGDSSNALEAWNFVIGLARDGAVEYSGATETNLFGTNKVAMLVTTISRLASIYKYLKCEYGIINPPKGPQAQDYLSEMSWFTPISVMRGANNPAGCVQVLNEYFSPVYAKSSAENKILMESELMFYLSDEGSMNTAFNIANYTSAQNYYLYQMVEDGDTQMLSYLYGNAWAFISGETTPEVFYASVKDTINTMVASSR